MNNWKKKIRDDYKNILSEDIIEETVKYWEEFLEQQKQELIKEIDKISYIIDDSVEGKTEIGLLKEDLIKKLK